MEEIEIMSDKEFTRFYSHLKREVECLGEDYDNRRKVLMSLLPAGMGTKKEKAFTCTQLRKCFGLGFGYENEEDKNEKNYDR